MEFKCTLNSRKLKETSSTNFKCYTGTLYSMFYSTLGFFSFSRKSTLPLMTFLKQTAKLKRPPIIKRQLWNPCHLSIIAYKFLCRQKKLSSDLDGQNFKNFESFLVLRFLLCCRGGIVQMNHAVRDDF